MTVNGIMETIFRMAVKKYKVLKAPIYGCPITKNTIWGEKNSGKFNTI